MLEVERPVCFSEALFPDHLQHLALGLSGVMNVEHDAPEFVREGVFGLRLGGVEGIYIPG